MWKEALSFILSLSAQRGMELSKIKRVYFVGIGGIGMSALASYFAKRGVRGLWLR
jgi:tRNA A37 threonylcarbamoyladenosine dehydratase